MTNEWKQVLDLCKELSQQFDIIQAQQKDIVKQHNEIKKQQINLNKKLNKIEKMI